jgi:toxin FitB
MSYLVDANVLSEPTKPAPDETVILWLRTHEGELFVDPVILGELDVGVQSLPRRRTFDRFSSGRAVGSDPDDHDRVGG